MRRSVPRRARRAGLVAGAFAVLLPVGVAVIGVAPVGAAEVGAVKVGAEEVGAAGVGATRGAARSVLVARAAEPDPDAQLPEPTADPEQSRQTADDILAGEEYQPPEPSLLQRVLNWIGEQLAKLFQGAPTPAAGGGDRSVVAWVVLAVLVGLAALLVWRFVRLPGRRHRGDGEEDEPFDIELTTLRTGSSWATEADRFEAAGQWKDAVRARFRAIVAELLEAGAVDDLPGRTTGEYRALVRRDTPGASSSFAAAADVFDSVWYGNRPADRRDAERLRALAEDVRAGLALGADADAGPAPLEVPA